MQKQFVCIIPARHESSRFPGKPLALIAGKPMIIWVIEHANKSKYIKEALVATDNEDIYKTVTDAGFKAVYTSKDCPNGSERVAEVAARIDDEWIFEMQGDQPMVTPEVIDNFIDQALTSISVNKEVEVVIPYAPISATQSQSKDILKVVVTESNRLVFQTRQPIQSGFRTLGLYLWSNKALQNFASKQVSEIERIEDSHPIRLYVNDVYVQGVFIEDSSWVEVDRPEQIGEVESLINKSK
ncbi:NTP transferase domain-containing protein [Candidatus Nomurabacteria bacterium]|nr:NTP transferase domain-containing protein [Candidatus Nomurabacteria bacterium]